MLFKAKKPKQTQTEAEIRAAECKAQERAYFLEHKPKHMCWICGRNWAFTEIEKVEERRMYDCTWRITLSNGSCAFSFFVTRRSGETLERICDALQTCHTEEDILALDQRNCIYYD